MTQLLISVTSVDEARLALQSGADFIDMKNPDDGALGALPLQTVSAIVDFVRQEAGYGNHTSATIGDLPMDPELIASKVVQLAGTGVDIIKIGFFSTPASGNLAYGACLDRLKPLALNGFKLVAVLLAEHKYPADLLDLIKKSGFYGVMLDTANKNGGTVLDYFSEEEIRRLSAEVRRQDMLFGLAGSLSIRNVEKIKQFTPSYIGFRGGVCEANQRKSRLDPDKILAIRKLM